MSGNDLERNRDQLLTFHSPALDGNAIGASSERCVRVYLPPGYESSQHRYPVVYLLHGYGGGPRHPIVDSREKLQESFPLLVRLICAGLFRRLVTFETLDKQISRGELPPFILVQPDGSLHLPHRTGGTHPGGELKHKGGMYYDSPGTGNFGSSVFIDTVEFIDSTFRTRADRDHRAVIGGSMGGYGALLAGIFHPDRFCAVAALSPSVCGLDVLDIELYVPFLRFLHGKAGAKAAGRADLADILDTCDMVFSPGNPLVPSIERDPTGRAVSMDPDARENWQKADAGVVATETPGAFSGVALRISCEEHDEFGFAGPDRRLSDMLNSAGIEHELHIFSDPAAARISGHSAGIAGQVAPGLRFCLDHVVVSQT